MAASKSIREALSALSDNILETESLSRTCADLAGMEADPAPPAWVFVFERHMERIKTSAEALEVLIRQKALPLMEDIEGANQRR